jgi:26S proteasome regulatory subunit N12
LKKAFEAEPCDLAKCEAQLVQLKLLLFAAAPGAPKDPALERETLELACFLSIRNRDLEGFERHVAQLKMYYDNKSIAAPSAQKHPIYGLYLLHLLASDRIGEFHTELELISVDDYDNVYIKQPIQLERYLMEGNYTKILEAQKDVPQMYYSFFMERLIDTVRQKVGASLERSYEHLPAQQAALMLILADVAALQEFALKENERKAREETDDAMGETTPASLTRRNVTGLVRWEVRDGRLYFKRSEEKRLEIPALEIMGHTIGYATDLERIV